MSVRAAALIVLAASGMPAAESPHDDEIKIFASTMAIAKTVKANCPDLVVDDRFLEALRRHLNVIEADHPAFARQARQAADALQDAVAQAPSRQAWCNAVFDLYGPEGRLMRKMLARP